MSERRALGMLLACLVTGIAAAADRHVCVPAADGGWNCGDAAQPPQAAALPQRAASAGSEPVPPVLLMDPARFQVERSAIAAQPVADAAEPAVPPQSHGVSAQAAEPAPAAPATHARAAPASAEPAVAVAVAAPVKQVAAGELRAFTGVARTGYTLQLAAARSPDGFRRRLQDLGIPLAGAFAVPVQRSGSQLWLLCSGEYADTASAMANRPAGAADAFPKSLAQLHAEHEHR